MGGRSLTAFLLRRGWGYNIFITAVTEMQNKLRFHTASPALTHLGLAVSIPLWSSVTSVSHEATSFAVSSICFFTSLFQLCKQLGIRVIWGAGSTKAWWPRGFHIISSDSATHLPACIVGHGSHELSGQKMLVSGKSDYMYRWWVRRCKGLFLQGSPNSAPALTFKPFIPQIFIEHLLYDK